MLRIGVVLGTCACDAPSVNVTCADGATLRDGRCDVVCSQSTQPCDDGNSCTDDDRCNDDHICVGVVRTCNTPPASTCTDGDTTYRTYASLGVCDPMGGDCVYEEVDISCPSCALACATPCSEGSCPGDDSGCLAGLCTGGTPIVCSQSALPEGTPCTLAAGGAGVCSGVGACVACLVDDDCAGNDLCEDNVCVAPVPPPPAALYWPIDCDIGGTCSSVGYPDVDDDGQAFNCGAPGYTGHDGSDIRFSWTQMDAGIDVLAAADGQVLWVFDGKYDRCPNAAEADCKAPTSPLSPNMSQGYAVCTPLGPYCGSGTGNCFWCFFGANVVVIRHQNTPGVFATRYDHLRNGSIVVTPGQTVTAGQKIAEGASAGNSTGPHLHFEVWGAGFYDPVEPWAGACGPNVDESLWEYDPPWSGP